MHTYALCETLIPRMRWFERGRIRVMKGLHTVLSQALQMCKMPEDTFLYGQTQECVAFHRNRTSSNDKAKIAHMKICQMFLTMLSLRHYPTCTCPARSLMSRILHAPLACFQKARKKLADKYRTAVFSKRFVTCSFKA